MIDIRIDASAFLAAARKQLEDVQKQVPFAVAKGVTDLAKQAAADVTAELPKVFDRPTPFTMRGIAYRMATKQTLTSTVFIRDIQAAYLRLQVSGGQRFPKGRALVLPTDYPTDVYGNLPRGTIKRLLARKDTFSGTVHGVPGIWMRRGRTLTLLVSYEPKATYQKRFDFEGIVRQSLERNANRLMNDALAYAIRTAR